VSHGEEVALAMRRLHPQPLSMRARWIVGRELICFERRGATLLPDFQFDASTWLPRPCVRRVVRELRDVCDDVELASWFVSSNAWLEERTPAEAIETQPEAVLDAARADRFIAAG
jgi:hypothetical protein